MSGRGLALKSKNLIDVSYRERVRNAILSYIDVEAWNHCARIETAERESLRSFEWKGVFSDQSQNTGGES
jgi:hypothetical protein